MAKRLVASLLLIFMLLLLTMPAAAQERTSRRSRKTWIVSALALAAASVLDARTSLGHYEANPLLRNAQGQFSPGRAFALKAGGTATILAAQVIFCRNNPGSYRTSALVNFASAGAFTGLAVRNTRIPR